MAQLGPHGCLALAESGGPGREGDRGGTEPEGVGLGCTARQGAHGTCDTPVAPGRGASSPGTGQGGAAQACSGQASAWEGETWVSPFQ